MAEIIFEKLVCDPLDAEERLADVLAEVEGTISRIESYEKFYQRSMDLAEAQERDRLLIGRLENLTTLFEPGFAPPQIERLISHGRQLRSHDSRKRWLKRMSGEVRGLMRALDDDDVPQTANAPAGVFRAAPRTVLMHYRQEEMLGGVVESLLRKLRLSPVHLRADDGGGKTLMERAAIHRDAACVIVLLSEDELAPEIDGPDIALELGFLIGRFGRGGVRALTLGDVALPRELGEDIAIPVDTDGAWREALCVTLNDLGYDLGAVGRELTNQARAS